jgi:hypothetical protein
MAKVFTKFGLKRDLNLSDLDNSTTAVNNILKDLTDNSETFTFEDIDLLQDIYLTNITKSTFTDASAATILQLLSNGQRVPYDPLITFSNRIDRAYFTTSEPFFFGGNGLTARYYDNDKILRSNPGVPSSTFNGFINGSETQTDLFWENGLFKFTSRFLPELVSLYGGVQWTGYFKPIVNGEHFLSLRTSGFLKVEFDDFTQSREFSFDSSTGTFNYLNVDYNRMQVLVDQTRLSASIGSNIVNASSALGTERVVQISLGSLSAYEAYKIRITQFISEDAVPDGANISRRFQVSFRTPLDNSFRVLNYKNLYDESYFTNYNIGDFKSFVDNTISLGGTEVEIETGSVGTIGDVQGSFIDALETPSKGDSYRNLNNIAPIISNYAFPTSISSTEVNVSDCRLIQSNKIITFVDRQNTTNPDPTENIELGNFVFGNGIPVGCRVTKIVPRFSIEVDPEPTSGGTVNLTFVNHRGLIAYGVGDVAKDDVTNITNSFGLADIKENQILLSNGLSFTYDDETTGTTNSTAVGKLIQEYDGSQILLKNTEVAQAIGNQKFYIYQTSGLNSDGLDFFCQDAVKTRLVAPNNDTSSISVTLSVEDVSDISLNDYVHAFPTINFGTRSDGSVTETFSRVQVTAIDSNADPNTVTITRTSGTGAALLSGLEYNPEKIKNIVFTSSDINKEVCFRPTDTSPPFNANSTGLTTPNDVSFVDDFGGNYNQESTISYTDLSIITEERNLTSVISGPEVDGGDIVSKYIPITDGNNIEYYIILGER